MELFKENFEGRGVFYVGENSTKKLLVSGGYSSYRVSQIYWHYLQNDQKLNEKIRFFLTERKGATLNSK